MWFVFAFDLPFFICLDLIISVKRTLYYCFNLLKFLVVDYRHSDVGLTSLMTCASHGMIDHVEQLITIGADPSVKGPGGVTAISLAYKSGHGKIANLLKAQWSVCSIIILFVVF